VRTQIYWSNSGANSLRPAFGKQRVHLTKFMDARQVAKTDLAVGHNKTLQQKYKIVFIFPTHLGIVLV